MLGWTSTRITAVNPRFSYSYRGCASVSTKLTVLTKIDCRDNTFVPQVTWESTGDTTIQKFGRVLIAEADSFKVNEIVS